MDPSSYSLFESVKGMLEQEDFMVDGRSKSFDIISNDESQDARQRQMSKMRETEKKGD